MSDLDPELQFNSIHLRFRVGMLFGGRNRIILAIDDEDGIAEKRSIVVELLFLSADEGAFDADAGSTEISSFEFSVFSGLSAFS